MITELIVGAFNDDPFLVGMLLFMCFLMFCYWLCGALE